MVWLQRTLQLGPFPRGFHAITGKVVASMPELPSFRVGLLHLFLQHTSASLSINENADPDVRIDLEMALNTIVSEDYPYIHTVEGPDDMPAHVKSSLLGCSVVIPIQGGHLALGTWQGIYLCEHRDHATPRSVVATMQGET